MSRDRRLYVGSPYQLRLALRERTSNLSWSPDGTRLAAEVDPPKDDPVGEIFSPKTDSWTRLPDMTGPFCWTAKAQIVGVTAGGPDLSDPSYWVRTYDPEARRVLTDWAVPFGPVRMASTSSGDIVFSEVQAHSSPGGHGDLYGVNSQGFRRLASFQCEVSPFLWTLGNGRVSWVDFDDKAFLASLESIRPDGSDRKSVKLPPASNLLAPKPGMETVLALGWPLSDGRVILVIAQGKNLRNDKKKQVGELYGVIGDPTFKHARVLRLGPLDSKKKLLEDVDSSGSSKYLALKYNDRTELIDISLR
ncbi:MAG TPA: hypothetical protein VG944_17870 [Fimbriimonas sp.]|nr:hypothetical protein [Fimbriimonas sp.]